MSHNTSVERLLQSIDSNQLDYLEVVEERAVEEALRSWAMLRGVVRTLIAQGKAPISANAEELWSGSSVLREDRL